MRLKPFICLVVFLLMFAQIIRAQYSSKLGLEGGVFTGLQHSKSQSIQGLRMCSGVAVNVYVPFIWHRFHGLIGMGLSPQLSTGSLLDNSLLIRTRCLYSTVNAGLEYRWNLPQYGNQVAVYTSFNQMLKLAETNVWNSVPSGGFPAIWRGNYNAVAAGLGFYKRRGNRERKFQMAVDFSRYPIPGKRDKIAISGFSISCAVLRLDAPKTNIVNNRIARTLIGPATPD